ncbi:hypothetical protein D3C84_934760 [compost metagenome]
MSTATWLHALRQQLRGIRQASGQRLTLIHLIDNGVTLGLHRADRLSAHDHLQGLGDTGQAWQPLGPAGTRQQPQLDLWQPDFGVDLDDAVMTGQRHFKSAAQHRAMQHRQ